MARDNDESDWLQDHREALRAAAPEVPTFTATSRAQVWDQVEASATTPVRRRARWKSVAAAVAAAAVLGVAGTATAGVISAHTGKGPIDAEDLELGGPGERLDPRAADYAAVVGEITDDIYFPTRESYDRSLAFEIDQYTRYGGDARVSTGTLRLWMSGHALCSWANVWAGALRTDDTTAEAQATEVILGARNWTSISDTDPDLTKSSPFAWLPELEAAVRSDDPGAAKAALIENSSCLPLLAPELGMGERWW